MTFCGKAHILSSFFHLHCCVVVIYLHSESVKCWTKFHVNSELQSHTCGSEFIAHFQKIKVHANLGNGKNDVDSGLPDLFFSKKAKLSVKKGQKRAKPFTTICLLTIQIHIKTHLVHPQHLHKKTFNSKLFLEFVTYDRKMPKFYSFSKTCTVNKSTWKINSYFSIITKFWTLQSKQSSLL